VQILLDYLPEVEHLVDLQQVEDQMQLLVVLVVRRLPDMVVVLPEVHHHLQEDVVVVEEEEDLLIMVSLELLADPVDLFPQIQMQYKHLLLDQHQVFGLFEPLQFQHHQQIYQQKLRVKTLRMLMVGFHMLMLQDLVEEEVGVQELVFNTMTHQAPKMEIILVVGVEVMEALRVLEHILQ
jgi:hypothetical protein